jgi:hypothetical protein
MAVTPHQRKSQGLAYGMLQGCVVLQPGFNKLGTHCLPGGCRSSTKRGV